MTIGAISGAINGIRDAVRRPGAITKPSGMSNKEAELVLKWVHAGWVVKKLEHGRYELDKDVLCTDPNCGMDHIHLHTYVSR